VAFSRDGQLIVSGSDDGTLQLWDANSGKQIGTPFKGDQNEPVTSAVFDPGTARIVSGVEYRPLRVWPGPAAWHGVLCNKLTQNMSRQQWRDWVSPDIDYIKVCPNLPIPADG
jgi:WD40 repeat protein